MGSTGANINQNFNNVLLEKYEISYVNCKKCFVKLQTL